MAKNMAMQCGSMDAVSVVCTDPTLPLSGQPCRVGALTGVAETDEATGSGVNQGGGNPTGYTTVEFGPHVWNLPVHGANAGGNTAVAAGDTLYYEDGGGSAPVISKVATAGIKFGIALDPVLSGATTTIRVKHVQSI